MTTKATNQAPIRIEKSRVPSHLRQYFETDLCSSCYVCHTIQILREIRRVLRNDGVVFWNIGDTYSATRWSDARGTGAWSSNKKKEANPVIDRDGANLPAKNLCLIPFRVAIAAQEDGWWVRSVIIWNKPNPMPESVRDRPTESHEYILMLTKSARYYWDMEAVRETSIDPESFMGRRWRSYSRNDYSKQASSGELIETDTTKDIGAVYPNRNLRSVWTFPTQGYPKAHFATYPEALPEKCIKAATPEVGCCSKCGKPWVRIIETIHIKEPKIGKGGVKREGLIDQLGLSKHSALVTQLLPVNTTLGWQPQCKCNAEKIGSIVLDPFAGSGTTLKVAAELGQRAIGYELSKKYCRLIIERNKQSVMRLEV